MSEHHYYVYILASTFKRLYAGVTNNLERRVKEHQSATHPNSFTARYKMNCLVYFERFGNIHEALTREKEIKKWNCQKKIAVIVAANPTWQDLSQDFGKPIPPFREEYLTPPITF